MAIEWADSAHRLIAFAGNDERAIYAVGPQQSSKSYPLSDAFTAYILINRWPSDMGFDGFGVFCPSMEQVDSILSNMQEAAERYGATFDKRADGTAYLQGHRIIGKPIASKGSRKGFHGKRLGAVLIDEATLCDKESYDYAEKRANRAPIGKSKGKIFVATNPDHMSHWFKLERVDRYPERVVKSTLDDNPSLGEETKADWLADWSGAILQRMYYGKWASQGGQVWPNFKDAVKPAPDGRPAAYDMSADFGSENPTHAILWGRYRNGHTRALSEKRLEPARNGYKTPDEQAAILREWIGDRRLRHIWYDPAALHFGLALRKAFPTVKVIPALNDVDEGVQQCDVFLNRGVVSVDDSCYDTIRECTGYSWDEKALARGAPETPLKENDHAPDTFRYYLYSEAKTPRVSVSRMVA